MGIPVKVLPIVGGGAPSEPGVPLAVGVVVVGGAVVVVGVLAGDCGVVVVGGAGVAVVVASASALCPSGLWAARS